MGKKLRKFAIIFILPFLLSACGKARVVFVRILGTESTVKSYPLPEKTNWKPRGLRKISKSDNINAGQVLFGRALHTDIYGTDEIATVIAPAFELDWKVEPNMFVTEGPVFDSDGNIYFCPVLPPEDIMMVSLEPENGNRRWVLKGATAGAGTPMVLMDPETGKDVLYLGTYERAVAVKTDGTIVWDVHTGLPKPGKEKREGEKHSFGMNYHPQSDSVLAAMGDGHVYVLDRKTGTPLLNKPFLLPGDRTPITNFKLPDTIKKKANEDAAHMFGTPEGFDDPISAVLHGAAGELQKLTNFFSVDGNTGRIWMAATVPDEEDGKKDGWADFAALYGLDLVKDSTGYHMEVKIVFKVPGGTASTPAISQDGKRVYIADAYDSIYAVDAQTGEQIWTLNVGNKVNGSLVNCADNGEIFVNIRTKILKVIEKGDHAELAWTADLDMYETGMFLENFNSLGAEAAANGIAFTGAAGFILGKQKMPLRLGAGLIDRETGKIIFFADGAEDSVSSMVTAPDGVIYVGNSPLRRVLGRAILGKSNSPQPVVGGITKFKPIHTELIIRDALWAAANRARNTATFVATHQDVAEADIRQIRQLLAQSLRTGPKAVVNGDLSQMKWNTIKQIVDQVGTTIVPEEKKLIMAADLLVKAVQIVEE